MKALQLLVLLSAVGAFAWCPGAGASPAATAATWLAPVSRIAAVSLHESDEVIARHGFKVELLLKTRPELEGIPQRDEAAGVVAVGDSGRLET